MALANLPYLSGAFIANPLALYSGMATHVQRGPIPGFPVIDPNIGFTSQALGHRAALDWLSGRVPWWNPYEAVGTPLAGEMQSAALFPLTLVLAAPGGQLVFHMVLEALSGMATYLLVRRLGAAVAPSTLAGVAFALNGTFAWFGHAPVNPIAFLPLALLGVERARAAAEARRGQGWILLGVALALSLYAGFPETAFIDGLLIGLWSLVRVATLRRSAWLPCLARLAAGGLSGVLLAAPVLVAFFDYLPYAAIGAHNGAYGYYSMPAAGLPMAVLPYVYGPVSTWSGVSPAVSRLWGDVGGYTTAGLVLLAVLALAGRPQRALRIALAAWVALALARTFGFPPAVWLLRHVHYLAESVFFRYADPSWELALAVLAALGADDLLAGRASRRRVAGAGALGLALVGLAAAGARPIVGHLVGVRRAELAWAASVAWAAAVVLGLCALGLWSSGRARAFAICGLVSFEVLAMFMLPEFSADRAAHIDTAPIRWLRGHLGLERVYSLGALAPDYSAYYGIAAIDDNDLPVPSNWAREVTRRLQPNGSPFSVDGLYRVHLRGPGPLTELRQHLRAYQSLGVRYLLTRRPVRPGVPSPGVGNGPVWEDRYYAIWKLSGARPYWTAGAGCKLRPVSRSKVVADCSRSASLLRRETWMPGWSATVAGKPARVREVDGLFQEVKLPPGSSPVAFSYRPPGTTAAQGAAAIGLGAVIAAAAWGRLGRRRSRQFESK